MKRNRMVAADDHTSAALPTGLILAAAAIASGDLKQHVTNCTGKVDTVSAKV